MNRTLRGRRVAIVGLAKSGLAAAKLCLREGARVEGFDKKPEADIDAVPALRGLGVAIHAGGGDADQLGKFDLLVVSPGVPLANAEIAAAVKSGATVIGEVELASWFVTCPMIGITGTNGKSTTTALAGHIAEVAGFSTFAGGNLGRPLSEAVLDGNRYEIAVVELSSFQLEAIPSLRPQVAVVTNLTPDHLDRYPSLEAYAAAKRNIFVHQTRADFGVVNADDPVVREMPRDLPVQVVSFGRIAVPDGGMRDDGTALTWNSERYRIESRALRGSHNRENAMAAVLACRLAGIPASAVEMGLGSYPGLPHRLEYIRTVDGVEFINDSKATNVDSAVVGVKAFEKNVWLIAGGRGKGAPYAPLVEAARGRVKAVLTIGEDANAIGAAFAGVAEVVACSTLENAIRVAKQSAQRGDVVLLSPACASYDQFRNFEQRGQMFRTRVEAL
jgi:UDP-N-acetylmuramoylalanine--D-glutamate ligase